MLTMQLLCHFTFLYRIYSVSDIALHFGVWDTQGDSQFAKEQLFPFFEITRVGTAHTTIP